MIPQFLDDGMTNPEWVKAHVGVLTASRMADAMAVTKAKTALHVISADGEIEKLGNGKTAEKKAEAARKRGDRVEVLEYEPAGEYARRANYRNALVAERLTGFAVDHYVTPEMQWGLDHEAANKAAYEVHTGYLLDPAGFILHPTIEYFGATPDAFVMTERGRGVFEAKCPTTDTHLNWLIANIVPTEHRPQLIAQMLCSGCSYAHFSSFDPRLPEKQRLFVKLFIPTAEEIAAVEAAARQFLREVDVLHQRLMDIEPESL